MQIFNDYENINITSEQGNGLIEEIINKCANLMKDKDKLESDVKEKDTTISNLTSQVSQLKITMDKMKKEELAKEVNENKYKEMNVSMKDKK